MAGLCRITMTRRLEHESPGVFCMRCFQTRHGFSPYGAAGFRVGHTMSRLTIAPGLLLSLAASAEDWPQFRGPNRGSVWHETGILQTFPTEGLNVRWRAPIGAGH